MSQPRPSHDYDEIWSKVYGDMQEDGPVHRHLKRILGGILDELEYATVLDVGCGVGSNLKLITAGRTLKRVTGIDVSAYALTQARQRLPGDYVLYDIHNEPLAGTWDLVFSSLLLEHLEDDERALSHLRSMTGRYLLLATIGGDRERYRRWEDAVGHVRNYRRGELEEKLDRAGFEVERSLYWGFPFYSPLARQLQSRSRIGTGRFNPGVQMVAKMLYWLYFFNSWRRGDVLIFLARPA